MIKMILTWLTVNNIVHKSLISKIKSIKIFINFSENRILMNKRDSYLLALRPEIPSAKVTENMSADEQFQNATLRPVIKLQDKLLLAAFKNYIQKHKNVFYELSLERRLAYIDNAIHKDTKFRNSLKGMVIGQFTIEEYETYIQNSSALNKRMMNLVSQRLQDNVQLLEKAIAC